jgi:(p)ppGpp synthase/HD superfamily hydrolase
MALAVHGGQNDKGGEPYLGHVHRVANAAVKGIPYGSVVYNNLWIVAILHDVVEDCDLESRNELLDDIIDEQGLSVNLAIQAITHRHWVSEPYVEYLDRVKENDLATRVKIADIRDNLNPDRLIKVLRFGTAANFNRLTEVLTKRYIKALDFLS